MPATLRGEGEDQGEAAGERGDAGAEGDGRVHVPPARRVVDLVQQRQRTDVARVGAAVYLPQEPGDRGAREAQAAARDAGVHVQARHLAQRPRVAVQKPVVPRSTPLESERELQPIVRLCIAQGERQGAVQLAGLTLFPCSSKCVCCWELVVGMAQLMRLLFVMTAVPVRVDREHPQVVHAGAVRREVACERPEHDESSC